MISLCQHECVAYTGIHIKEPNSSKCKKTLQLYTKQPSFGNAQRLICLLQFLHLYKFVPSVSMHSVWSRISLRRSTSLACILFQMTTKREA